MTIPGSWYLTLAAVIFSMGALGLLVRRNVLVMFMCIELMLNAVNLTLVTFSRMLGDIGGQVLVFFVLVVAAAELQVADPPMGILFLLAMSSVAVYGVMLAGWNDSKDQKGWHQGQIRSQLENKAVRVLRNQIFLEEEFDPVRQCLKHAPRSSTIRSDSVLHIRDNFALKPDHQHHSDH